jgi:hypothetical protein
MKNQRELSRSLRGILEDLVLAILLLDMCASERWRVRYQSTNSEATIKTSIIVSSIIVFIYLPLLDSH